MLVYKYQQLRSFEERVAVNNIHVHKEVNESFD